MAESIQQLFFGNTFLEEHAGQIIRDPKVAVAELVANAWDASATRVEITWPTEDHPEFSVVSHGVV